LIINETTVSLITASDHRCDQDSQKSLFSASEVTTLCRDIISILLLLLLLKDPGRKVVSCQTKANYIWHSECHIGPPR